MSNTTDPKARRLDQTLETVTDEAKNTLGDAANRTVTVGGSLDVSVTEDGKTTNDGVKASVTLETSHSETGTKAS